VLRAELIIEGDVQGVGFRYAARRLARRKALTGYVKNLPDGRVAVTVEGPEEAIQQFQEDLRSLKPPIRVENIQATYKKATGKLRHFNIITGTLKEEMVDGFSTGASYFEVMFTKQDQMLEKQDKMLEKQDKMLEKQDQMLEKQDKMLEKQDKMLEKQDKMLEKQDQMLGKQDQMLGKLDQISGKLDQVSIKQDQMLEKQDELISEVKGMREDLRSMLEERFTRIEHDLAAVKLKLGMV